MLGRPYRVIVEGDGFVLAPAGSGGRSGLPDSRNGAVGSYTSVWLWSRSEAEARVRALRLVEARWSTPDYRAATHGVAPRLTVDDARPVSVLDFLGRRIALRGRAGGGHTFYGEE